MFNSVFIYHNTPLNTKYKTMLESNVFIALVGKCSQSSNEQQYKEKRMVHTETIQKTGVWPPLRHLLLSSFHRVIKNKINTASFLGDFFSQYQSNYKNKNHLNFKSPKSAIFFFFILKIIQEQVQKQMPIQTSTCPLLFPVPLFILDKLWTEMQHQLCKLVHSHA